MSVVKPKPKLSLWLIFTKDTGNPVNQSTLEANTSSWHKARENAREKVAIGFGFTSDWLRKWRELFKQITERSNAKLKQRRVTFRHSSENALKQFYSSQ